VFRTRAQLFRAITPDYYGFRDEEDGVLLSVEVDAEAAMQAKVGGCC
jgi:pre-mRNA-splicing factor ISY1